MFELQTNFTITKSLKTEIFLICLSITCRREPTVRFSQLPSDQYSARLKQRRLAHRGPTAPVVPSGCRCNLGIFSNGDGSENVTIVMKSRFSKRRRDYSNAVFKCQMKVKLTGVEFLETAPKFRKRKKNWSSCVYVFHKISHQETSRPSRVVTAKKCTKKCNARAELLFWLLNLLLF